MKKILRVIIVLAVIALLVLLAVRAVKHKKAEEASMPPAKEYEAVVRTIEPKVEDVTLTVPYIAIVQNDDDAVIASKLAARVETIKRAGDRVNRGEVVARLDTADLKARLDAVKAQIEAAKEGISAKKTALSNLKAAHARTEKLLKVKGASQEQFEAEESKIAATKAAIAETEAKIDSLAANEKEIANLLSYAVIKAPVSGTVGKAFVNGGDMAMPGKPLLSISAETGDYLLVRLPDSIEAGRIIHDGKTFRLHSLNHTFNGLKEYRSERVDSGLSTGERVDVDLVLFKGRGIMLPTDAVLNKNGKQVVIEIENSRAKTVPVTLKASGEQGVVVSGNDLAGKRLAVAKPDIMLNLLSGVAIKVSEK